MARHLEPAERRVHHSLLTVTKQWISHHKTCLVPRLHSLIECGARGVQDSRSMSFPWSTALFSQQTTEPGDKAVKATTNLISSGTFKWFNDSNSWMIQILTALANFWMLPIKSCSKIKAISNLTRRSDLNYYPLKGAANSWNLPMKHYRVSHQMKRKRRFIA